MHIKPDKQRKSRKKNVSSVQKQELDEHNQQKKRRESK